MKNLTKTLLTLSVCASLFTSCVAMYGVNLNKISLGMDKQQVVGTLKSKPVQTIGSRKYPNGIVEVWNYSDNGTPKWLYFYNDKLMEISIPSRDWQREADTIVADNDPAFHLSPVADGVGTRGGK